MIPAHDNEYLSGLELETKVTQGGGITFVVIYSWPLPAGLDCAEADLMLQLPVGYPDIPPDMWWFSPSIQAADGTKFPNADTMENHLDKEWQRWSRHLDASQWQSGTDSIESYIAIIKQDIVRGLELLAPGVTQ